jgi:hydrogenase/urease accessory protein HupE
VVSLSEFLSEEPKMKNRIGLLSLTALATVTLGNAAQAHSGHGMDGGILHQLTSAYHLGIMLAVALIAATGKEIVCRRNAKKTKKERR